MDRVGAVLILTMSHITKLKPVLHFLVEILLLGSTSNSSLSGLWTSEVQEEGSLLPFPAMLHEEPVPLCFSLLLS